MKKLLCWIGLHDYWLVPLSLADEQTYWVTRNILAPRTFICSRCGKKDVWT